MKKNYNILIVEDEVLNAEFASKVIQSLGHTVVGIASNANDALEIANDYQIDLALMDINIEGPIDGIICAELLNKKRNIPIIYTTAYGDTDTIQEASETNIFGFIIKPFDIHDIEASLNVAIKRINNLEEIIVENKEKEIVDTIHLGNSYFYNLKTKTFSINGIIIKLTKKETQVLHLFCLNINHNISYDLLLEYVWEGKVIADSTIRDTILRLRKKAPLLQIENISGIGYCLKNL